jgi:hypothetical protein
MWPYLFAQGAIVIESKRSIGNLINVVQREALRTRLLFALDELYPKWLRTDLLYEIDKDMPLNVFEKELAYLEEKGLVQSRVSTVFGILQIL